MDKHTYPDAYIPGPDQHWAINEAWEILDLLPVGVLSNEQRALLSGVIAGTLMRVKEERCS